MESVHLNTTIAMYETYNQMILRNLLKQQCLKIY